MMIGIQRKLLTTLPGPVSVLLLSSAAGNGEMLAAFRSIPAPLGFGVSIAVASYQAHPGAVTRAFAIEAATPVGFAALSESIATGGRSAR